MLASPRTSHRRAPKPATSLRTSAWLRPEVAAEGPRGSSGFGFFSPRAHSIAGPGFPKLAGLANGKAAGNARCVITEHEVMQLLLEACPSFHEPWQTYRASPSYAAGQLYVDLGAFARHLVALKQSDTVEEFPAVFSVVERLNLDGDRHVTDAVTMGLLEGIQNVASHTSLPPESFVRYLHPESAKSWTALNSFWAGKYPHA